MLFKKVDDHIGNMMLCRREASVSDPRGYKAIEIAVYPVLFGMRIRVGYVGDLGLMLDYCAGIDQDDVEKLYGAVLKILSDQETPDWSVFPGFDIKPIFNDPTCWKRLEELAGDYEPVDLPPVSLLRNVSQWVALNEMKTKDYNDKFIRRAKKGS